MVSPQDVGGRLRARDERVEHRSAEVAPKWEGHRALIGAVFGSTA